MLVYEVQAGGCLQGQVSVPGDKSISHRALLLGAIATGTSTISGLLHGEDVLVTASVLRQLGVEIESEGDPVRIHGVGLHGLQKPAGPLDLGNSGTAVRLLMGLLAAQPFASILVGDASLSRRPMGRVVEPLRSMGASITMSAGDTLPVHIGAVEQLHGVRHALSIASAQVKSALLLGGLYAEGRTAVHEPAPTRDHTERMLRGFGYPVVADGGWVAVDGGGELRGRDMSVPRDLSSAAFFLVGASIAPESRIVLPSVGLNPTRIGVISVLRDMGASIEVENERVEAGEPVADLEVRNAPLHGVAIGQEQVALAIDELPILAIAAACAQGTTIITGAEELRVKESDRIAATVSGLCALGVTADERPDGMVIEGGGLNGGTIESYGDHRIAMAFAIAGLAARESITVRDCANVATSFPDFAELARSAGLRIAVRDGK